MDQFDNLFSALCRSPALSYESPPMFIIYSPRIMRMMFKGHSRFLHDFCVSLSYCFFGFNVILHEKLGICNKNQEIAKNILGFICFSGKIIWLSGI